MKGSTALANPKDSWTSYGCLRGSLSEEQKVVAIPVRTLHLFAEDIDISLDHDLGNDDRGTGYDVVLWIEEQVALHCFVPPTMKVHSANVSARTKMESGIRAIEAMVNRRKG